MSAMQHVDSDDPGWHRFTATVNDEPFAIEISARHAATATEARAIAETLLPKIVDSAWTITQQCAADLLDDYNDEWADSGTLDSDAFRSRLTLCAFGVMPNGHVRARFSDGDLFGGHEVVVDLDPELTPTTTLLEG